MSAVECTRATLPPPSGRPHGDRLVPRDVANLVDQLSAYHAEFAPLSRRAEQRRWAKHYLAGQRLDLERKSIEPIARALEGGNIQALQQFIGIGAWDDDAILAHQQSLVAETLGDAETGVLIVDGCDFPKQGTHSVGVARQWCGARGKVANCQASVLACYASAKGDTLVDRRLYLPNRWFTEGFRPHRRACGVPADAVFQTRPARAVAMIAALRERGALPFRWVLGDESFGVNTAFLDQVAALGLGYFAEVPHDTRVWLQRPGTVVPPPKKHGRPTHRLRVAPGEPAALRVEALAAALPPHAWRRWSILEGTRGPLVAEFAMVRAVAVRDRLPGPAVWVVLRRGRHDGAELKVYLSNAPGDTAAETLVWLAGRRWPIESAILECTSELGFDQYAVRGWTGWHHHTTMTLLAHHFLVRLRRQLAGTAPALTTPQIRLLLQVILPRHTLDAVTALALVRETQRRNYAAYCAHRARRRADSS